MAQVPLQVGRAGAYHKAKEHGARVLVSDTSVALAAGANANVDGTNHEADGQGLEVVYVLSHDGTAGELTIILEHADSIAGSYSQVTDDALMLLGENQSVPEGSLVLDVSLAENQGTLLVTVSGSARELSGGSFVSELKPAMRLDYSTDGAWNGTEVREIVIDMYKHVPSGQPE